MQAQQDIKLAEGKLSTGLDLQVGQWIRFTKVSKPSQTNEMDNKIFLVYARDAPNLMGF